MQHDGTQLQLAGSPVWVQHAAALSRPGHPSPNVPQDDQLRGKLILLVIEGRPGRWRLLHRLRQVGLRLACYTNTAGPGWAEKYIPSEQWVSGPLDDAAEAVRRVRQWQAQDPAGRVFDGILCYDEFGVELTADMAESLSLPYMPLSVAASIRCKHAFRAVCHQGGLNKPRFVRLDGPMSHEAMAEHTAGLRYPVVVKPVRCAGSFSVVRCETPSDLITASNRYFSALPQYLASFGLTADASTTSQWGMIVEELVVGAEVDIDCVVVEGRLVFAVVSDNHPQPQSQECTTFIERGGRCPSVLPHEDQAALLRMARDVVSLWGPGLTGVFHLEALSTHDMGPVPIELNGRIGGAETYTNVLAAWRVDLVVQAARLAVSLPPQFTLPHSTTHLMHPQPPLPRLKSHPLEPLRAADEPDMETDQLDSSSEICTDTGAWAWPHVRAAGAWQPAALLLASRRSAESSVSASHVDSGSSLGTPTAASSSVCDLDDHMSTHSDEQHYTLDCMAALHKCRLARPSHEGQAPCTSASQPSHHSYLLKQDRQQQQDGAAEQQTEWGVGMSGTSRETVSDGVVLVRPLTHVYSVNFVPEWRGEGVLEEFTVSDETRSHPSYVDMELTAALGGPVKLPPAGFSALGWMVSMGDTAQRAEEAMGELMSGVIMRIGPPNAS